MHEFCKARSELTRVVLTKQFNAEFGADRAHDAVRCFCKRYGYHTGRTGCFPRGNVPHNKGMKGFFSEGSRATQFKKGHKLSPSKPIGYERKTTKSNEENYWQVKVSHPNVFRQKHHILWESVNGPIPKTHVVIFIDGDTDNIVIENLALVSRAELAILNKTYRWKSVPADERETILLMARLQSRVGVLSKQVELQ